ncbi:MAG: hypothetical protein ACKVS8_00715 [Phycisphaerales bacterium]
MRTGLSHLLAVGDSVGKRFSDARRVEVYPRFRRAAPQTRVGITTDAGEPDLLAAGNADRV